MSKGITLKTAIRENSPCATCTEKFTYCHDHCPKDKRGEFGYGAWKEERERVNKNRKDYESIDGRKQWSNKYF